MVTLKIFGTMRLKTGVGEMTLKPGPVKSYLPGIIENSKPSSRVRARDLHECVVMINGTQRDMNTITKDGDEVVFLSPSGGG